MPEKFENHENREEQINALIENLAQTEGMNSDDIFSDIVTFAELSKEDEDAKAYFEDLAERLGISLDEILEYAQRKLE